jgi:hypothetical protein
VFRGAYNFFKYFDRVVPGGSGAPIQFFLSLSFTLFLISLCKRKELVKEELKIYKKTSKILKLFFNVFKNM